MARKKKGSGKPRKKSAGGKAGARTKRASGSRATRTGSGRKAAPRAGRKKAAKKAGKKTARGKTPAKTARRKTAAKRPPARKKAAKKKAAKKKSSARKPARKAPARAKAAAKPARKSATARKTRAPGRDAAFFDHFRRKLLEQRENITRRLDDLRGELRGLEETPRELEEWAQEEKDRDILIRLEDRETDELRKIQAALQLIDQREYGLCQVCGKPIPRARLEELPTAFRCVDCTP
jgi:RNA polymerase-binding protein DksA